MRMKRKAVQDLEIILTLTGMAQTYAILLRANVLHTQKLCVYVCVCVYIHANVSQIKLIQYYILINFIFKFYAVYHN